MENLAKNILIALMLLSSATIAAAGVFGYAVFFEGASFPRPLALACLCASGFGLYLSLRTRTKVRMLIAVFLLLPLAFAALAGMFVGFSVLVSAVHTHDWKSAAMYGGMLFLGSIVLYKLVGKAAQVLGQRHA